MRKMPVAELLAVRDDARERMAREVFDINRVSALMAEAAGAGADGLRIVQELPRDLRGTRAAVKLQTWLTDNECKLTWVNLPRQCRDGQLAMHAELVICWEGDADALA